MDAGTLVKLSNQIMLIRDRYQLRLLTSEGVLEGNQTCVYWQEASEDTQKESKGMRSRAGGVLW